MEIVYLVLSLFLSIIGFMMLNHIALKPIPCGIIIMISAIVMFASAVKSLIRK